MQLPDNILRAHTPTLDENIKGAINDKDMLRPHLHRRSSP